MPRIKVKVLNADCTPERTHRWDAGWDLKAAEQVIIQPGRTEKVHTGVIMEIPPRHCGMVVPRSSLGTKYRITLANDVGIIDSEYRGEILVFLSNDGEEPYKVNKGDRFAQLVIVEINSMELMIVDSVSSTGRGSGGFGSTTAYDIEPLTIEEEALIPKVDLTEQAKEIAVEVDKRALAEAGREAAIEALKSLKPGQYTKLKANGMLWEKHPLATGDMKVDLCL